MPERAGCLGLRDSPPARTQVLGMWLRSRLPSVPSHPVPSLACPGSTFLTCHQHAILLERPAPGVPDPGGPSPQSPLWVLATPAREGLVKTMVSPIREVGGAGT